MRSRFVTCSIRCALLLLIGACARDVTSPVGSRTFISTRVVGNTLPAKQFCAAGSPYTEQWVILSRVELVTGPGDGFRLTATDEQDHVQFTTSSDGTRRVIEQYASGGPRIVAGVLLPLSNGVRVARVEDAWTLYTSTNDFTAQVFDDSAIVTDQVHCVTTVGNDSTRTFTAILK